MKNRKRKSIHHHKKKKNIEHNEPHKENKGEHMNNVFGVKKK